MIDITRERTIALCRRGCGQHDVVSSRKANKDSTIGCSACQVSADNVAEGIWVSPRRQMPSLRIVH